MSIGAQHWDSIYQDRGAEQVSWYQTTANVSLQLISQIDLPKTSPIIDVGGGASCLVDGLMAGGWQNITVLDLSSVALHLAQARLAPQSYQVNWQVGDITTVNLPQNYYYIWHDRAVFHFLTTQSDRQKYVAQIKHSLKQGGHLILATFALDGPPTCSGLPVIRYSSHDLQAEIGSEFKLIASTSENHYTPWGTAQQFTYCHWYFRAS